MDDRRSDGHMSSSFLPSAWGGQEYTYLALVIGAVVCIAISNAGTTAQDLKTRTSARSNAKFTAAGDPDRRGNFRCDRRYYDAAAERKARRKRSPLQTKFTATAEQYHRSRNDGPGGTGRKYLLVKVSGVEGIEPGNYLVDQQTKEAQFQSGRTVSADANLPHRSPNLMAVLITGLLEQKLPWHLIMIGACNRSFHGIARVSIL
jgi:hypothetical protein